MPFGPTPAGTVTHGTCNAVQSELNAGSPVAANPSGASPGAAGVTKISSPSIGPGNASCNRPNIARAASNAPAPCASPHSNRSRSPSLMPSRWTLISHPIDAALSAFITTWCAAANPSKSAGNSRISTTAPARPKTSAARAINATVSAAAAPQEGDRQIPMRGARPGLRSGSPRSRPATAPATSAQSATDRAITPMVSSDSLITFMPSRAIIPQLGL